jgi:iron(III)-enterobactin esterase
MKIAPCLLFIVATALLPVAGLTQIIGAVPTRPPNGPGAPKWIVVGGEAAQPGPAGVHAAAGMNPPVDQNGDFLIGPDYVQAPELWPAKGVPQGRIEQFTIDSKHSKLYPGTARGDFSNMQLDPGNPKTLIVKTHAESWDRTITVYIPPQYKKDTEVPFIVANDGPHYGSPDASLAGVLDNLINQHRLPAMIAVMIQNGGGDAQGSERGIEYDTLSGKYAEFVQQEVLPQVESRYHVKLTSDPDGRAVMGCSSGAAAAFTMAWFHPEWYHRVISYSGTFVNQQWPFNPELPDGAWDYHEKLIPQSDVKPIRIWMQVGDRDLFNPNILRDGMHDWVEANHRMAAALRDKGYQYQYVFALDASHCSGQVREQTLPEALEWVWRGYTGIAQK